jgi:hypothetical protein
MSQVTTSHSGSSNEFLSFMVSTVTGSQEIEVEFTPELSARSVVESIADRLALPPDVPWQLRDDGSSAYLDDEQSIGEQVEKGAHLTVSPKSHLGGGFGHSV